MPDRLGACGRYQMPGTPDTVVRLAGRRRASAPPGRGPPRTGRRAPARSSGTPRWAATVEYPMNDRMVSRVTATARLWGRFPSPDQGRRNGTRAEATHSWPASPTRSVAAIGHDERVTPVPAAHHHRRGHPSPGPASDHLPGRVRQGTRSGRSGPGVRPARRPGSAPSWSSCSVAPPRVSSMCLVIRKYRCSGYSRSTPTPPWRWTAAWTTRCPPSAAQNLAMATSLSAGRPSVDPPGRLPGGEPDGLGVDVGVGGPLAHGLEGGDGLAELLTRLGVLGHQGQRGRRRAGLGQGQGRRGALHQPLDDGGAVLHRCPAAPRRPPAWPTG